MPIYLYVQNQGKPIVQSHENDQKSLIWAIFWRFQSQISQNRKFFWKIGFIQIEGHI